MPSRRSIPVGTTFGYLTVERDAPAIKSTAVRGLSYSAVLAICRCGTRLVVRENSLKSGNTKSCGCFKREDLKRGIKNLKHGMSGSATYKIWRGMITRCDPKYADRYQYHSGKGIRVCARWEKFENFIADMGERPEGSERLTIERLDSNKGYNPRNCIWANYTQQAFNQTKTKVIKFDGVSLSLTAAASKVGVNPSSVIERSRALGLSYQEMIEHYAVYGKSRKG